MNINWIRLSDANRRTILEQTSERTGCIVQAVEKNLWVTSNNQINDKVSRALCSFVREELPDRVDNYNKLIGFLSNS